MQPTDDCQKLTLKKYKGKSSYYAIYKGLNE